MLICISDYQKCSKPSLEYSFSAIYEFESINPWFDEIFTLSINSNRIQKQKKKVSAKEQKTRKGIKINN